MERFSTSTNTNTAMIDGEEVRYDFCALSEQSYQDLVNAGSIEYIGFGTWYKHNGVKQSGRTRCHFWRRTKRD